jgi:hypothetical protein
LKAIAKGYFTVRRQAMKGNERILSKIQGKRNIFRRDRKQYAEIEMK